MKESLVWLSNILLSQRINIDKEFSKKEGTNHFKVKYKPINYIIIKSYLLIRFSSYLDNALIRLLNFHIFIKSVG